ncbi:MAG: hypothetical protein JSS72_08525 [Armatimonadetes bacterium]|nr:hypothetical protein [Armatimonadota bacterium]
MRTAKPALETWKRLVLRAMPLPAWLSPDAPQCDVVLSTRVRVMRNLAGHRFPHLAPSDERLAVLKEVLAATRGIGMDLEVNKSITNAEREYMVGARLISPDFAYQDPSAAVLLNEDRSLSLMVNEEDHLRIQALVGGWSLETARLLALRAEKGLASQLHFARLEDRGYLAASPFNCGAGVRHSCMLHLIGLASAKRLPNILKALGEKNLVARGPFGESSRAIGAFVQISSTSGDAVEFAGAVEYLIQEERIARINAHADKVAGPAQKAITLAQTSRTLTLADCLRVLGWVRWACIEGMVGLQPRQVDAFLSSMDIHASISDKGPEQARADALRGFLDMASIPVLS